MATNQEPCPISVVIATLGGATLQTTIDALNAGTIVPAEILVCVPRNESQNMGKLAGGNVNIVVTDCRGQVAQRCIGFNQATQEFVVQMDDDMFPQSNCLEILIVAIQNRARIAIAPALIDRLTNKSAYATVRHGGAFDRLYYWLMNGADGYKEGTILKSGMPLGVIPGCGKSGLIQVEWLPGGCVMHRRSELILENYFPFAGKAYCEDLIHSHLLVRSGVELFVETQAECGLYLESAKKVGFRSFIFTIKSELRARRYFLKMRNQGPLRMYLFYVALVVRYAVRTFK